MLFSVEEPVVTGKGGSGITSGCDLKETGLVVPGVPVADNMAAVEDDGVEDAVVGVGIGAVFVSQDVMS